MTVVWVVVLVFKDNLSYGMGILTPSKSKLCYRFISLL